MNTRKTSVLKTFIEYMGRGAVPVDGIYWVANSSETGTPARKTVEPAGFNAASNVRSAQPLGKCAPAARGT